MWPFISHKLVNIRLYIISEENNHTRYSELIYKCIKHGQMGCRGYHIKHDNTLLQARINYIKVRGTLLNFDDWLLLRRNLGSKSIDKTYNFKWHVSHELGTLRAGY